MDRIYLDKLDMNYFKACINEVMEYLDTEGFVPEEGIKQLETLYSHIVGLRDTFFIFNINDIEDMLKPVKEKMEYYRSELEAI